MLTLHESTEKKFRENITKMLQQGRLSEAKKMMDEHHRLITLKEEITCAEITKLMTQEHRDLANLLLRKICILSDIIDGAGLDLFSLLKKYDRYVELPLLLLIEHLRFSAKNINTIIDRVNNDNYASAFGDVCDKVDDMINDLFKRGEV